jgi:hypothetical protein
LEMFFDGAKPRDLQFCGPIVDMFFDRAQRTGETCGFRSSRDEQIPDC